MDLHLSPRRITRTLFVATAGLACAGIASSLVRVRLGHEFGFGLVPLFRLDHESNVPTWYSAAMLLTASVLAGVIARANHQRHDPFTRHWAFLAVAFLGLSLDEEAQLHELVGLHISNQFPRTGPSFLAWTIPGAFLVAGLGIAYARFLFHLPRRVGRLFILAGFLYVGSALGLEFIEAKVEEHRGIDETRLAMFTTVEELGEIVGIVVFIYALLAYVGDELGEVRLRVGDS